MPKTPDGCWLLPQAGRKAQPGEMAQQAETARARDLRLASIKSHAPATTPRKRNGAMAIVSEISWDDMLDGKPLPETPARQAWRAAVAELADKAKARLPECSGRVDAAVKLVLAGNVELLA